MPVSPEHRRATAARRLARGLPAVLSLGGVLAVWELYARLSDVRPTFLPGPSRVLEQMIAQRETLFDNALPTLQATLFGFALSLVASLTLSVLVDFSALLRRALFPLFVVSQTLPLVAIAPLVVLWFGFGLVPKVMLVALVTFFPMLVALVEGYRSTDPEMEWLLRSMGASRSQVFRLARLPSALPFFFAGLRISITYAVVGAIFAEYAGAAKGLGIYMLGAKNNFRPDLVLAAVAVSAALTLALFALAVLAERLAMPWAARGREGER